MSKIAEIVEGVRKNKGRKVFLLLIILGFILGYYGGSGWQDPSVAIVGGSLLFIFVDDEHWQALIDY